MSILIRKRARNKGIAVLLTSVSIVGAMTVIGLAVDVGMMYAVKVKLSAAADAAALAAARAIGTASNGGASVNATAQAYFAANYPAGYMLSTSSSITAPAPVVNANNSETQTVTATATLPLMFLRFLNFDNSHTAQTVNTTAAATRRNLNLVMVLDRSQSMTASGSCAPMVAAAQDFTNDFIDGQDSLGLVVFGGSYDIAFPMSKTFKSGGTKISTVIGTITCNGNTGSAQAIYQAHQMLSALPSTQTTGAINAVVFFTDGQPNGLTADWPINTAVYQKSVTGVAAVNTPAYANSTGLNSSSVSPGPLVSPWYTGYAPSGCSATVLKNGVATITGYIGRSNDHQHGIYTASTASTSNDGPVVANATGCAMASATTDSQGFSGGDRVHEDIAYIPAADTYGNITTGYWDTAPGTTKQTIPAGPYKGFVMLDFFQSGTCGSEPCGLFNNDIDLASMNAAEAAATSARTDPTTNIIIFSIGLGGAADQFPDMFLQHVANTPQSDLFNSAQPSGQYIYVTGAGQLGAAFQSIASFVLRLSS